MAELVASDMAALFEYASHGVIDTGGYGVSAGCISAKSGSGI
ncbi:MAG: hypothetical protein ACLTDS_05825 [Bianqueaceae bacterium]